jgi:hypothetical protein
MAQQTATVKYYAYLVSSWVQLLDIQPMSGFRGSRDNDPETRLADIGSIRLQLNNSTGIYTPGTTAGWKKGVPFKMVVTYEGRDYIKFRGAIDDIQLESEPADQIVNITALDWFDYASKYPVVNPNLLENVTADVAIDDIVNAMPIQPQAQSLEVGNTIFPTVFDTVKGNTKAYAEFQKLAASEVGYIYLKADATTGETLVFEASDTRNGTRQIKKIAKGTAETGFFLKEDGDNLLLEGGDDLLLDESEDAVYTNTYISMDVEYGRNIINRFTANAYPKKTDTTPVRLYETERNLFLAPNETKTFRVFWKDPTGKRTINARPPTGNSTTVSLVHFNTQDGVLFYDETGKVWTASEEQTFVNNYKKFGDGAAYLDATSSYLTTPHSQDWEFGSGDFCVEWWEFRFATTTGQATFSRDGTDAVPAWIFGRSNATNLLIDISSNGVSNDIANGKTLGAITINTWNHFAISRSGSNFYAWKNGALTDSWTSAAAIFTSSTPLYLGRNVSTYLGAIIDEVRITKGEPVYTTAFSVQTAEHSLLGTIYSMWTGINSSGTEITPYVVASADYGTEGATFAIRNSYTSGGYLTINTYGYGIYSDSAIEDTQEDTTSINTYGYQNEGLQQPYQQDLYTGKLEGEKVVELERNPRMKLNKITMHANTSAFLMNSFLNVDIGDLVQIVISKHGINGVYYVQGIEFSLDGGIITFSWIVKQAWTLYHDFTPKTRVIYGAVDDAITYGYIPLVSSGEVVRRVFSAWIWISTVSATYDRAIIANYTGDSGFSFQVDKHATDRYLSFRTKFDGAAGKWTCPANPFAIETWTHVLVFFDSSSASNNPVIYVNGAEQVLTETETPSGTVVSEIGSALHVGNYKTSAGFIAGWAGRLKDVRVYDMDKTSVSYADLAAGIYAEGVAVDGYYEGMVFTAFGTRGDIPDDTFLTSEYRLLDAYNGYVGTPNGTPILKIKPTDL